MPDTEISRVNGYFAKIGVAGIDLNGALQAGDTIRITGHTTDFSQTVESMELDHGPVEQATAGQSVGIKVADRCRAGDHVYKVAD